MKRQLFIFLLTSLFICMGCSDDDTTRFPIANTEWAAEITSKNISVPEEYRENSFWVLRFTDNEMTVAIRHNGYIVRYEFKGTYRLEGEKKIWGINANGSVNYDLYLEENGTYIYFPYFGKNFVKQ